MTVVRTLDNCVALSLFNLKIMIYYLYIIKNSKRLKRLQLIKTSDILEKKINNFFYLTSDILFDRILKFCLF